MNRFVKSQSFVFQLAAWFFVATLFCDAANLDDLFTGSIVLHDDEEVIAANLACPVGSATQMYGAQGIVKGSSGIRESAPLSPAHVRLIIDQDSPSLAAGQILIDFMSRCILENSPAASFESQLPIELRYLRFRSLLI